MKIFFWIAILSFTCIENAFANDSTAELAAGGLVFTKNPSIEMQSEDLFLSLNKVKIKYVFFNHSKLPVTALVAFPLPKIKSYRYDSGFTILPVDNPTNPVGFVTRVNNKPIKLSVYQKVIAQKIDQTSTLIKYNIPLSPGYSKTAKSLQRLPVSLRPQLEDSGLIRIEEFDAGQGIKKEPQPAWTLETTYTWKQTFPPMQSITIEHEYHPVIGTTVGTAIGSSYAIKEKWYQDYVKKYCISNGLQKQLTPKTKDAIAPYSESRLSYILKTGANWAGPIADFTLIIDKGNKKNLISFCGDNVKKISDTQFQMKIKNFTPTRNLNLLYLIPYPEKQ